MPAQTKPAWHAPWLAEQPAPGQVPEEQSVPQNFSPKKGELLSWFCTQRLVAAPLVQSSSLWQPAQSVPLLSGLHWRLGRSQEAPRPHSRATTTGSVESQ